MRSNQILGLVLILVGGVLLYFGFQATETFVEQLHESFTGRFTETTTLYLILGALSTIGWIGLFMVPSFASAD